MSATRTQVYLSDEQRERIDRAASADGVTMAEIVRRALDRYFSDDLDPTTALASTFGAAPQAETPSREAWRRG